MRTLLMTSTLCALAAALCAGPSAAAAPTPKPFELFNFSGSQTTDKLTASDVKVTPTVDGLRLAYGHNIDWPGITLTPEKPWDLSAYRVLKLAIRNEGDAPATLNCRVDNPGADGHNNCNQEGLEVAPGQDGVLTVTFKPRSKPMTGVKLFGMRGYPFGMNGAGTVDTHAVTALVIFVGTPKVDTVWRLTRIWAEGAAPTADNVAADKFLPFVDAYGQYIHRTWPGKITGLVDLKSRVIKEARDLKKYPGPTDFDKWGGWNDGPQLEATGWFRTQKVDGKWWLVDPDGRLFWSHGVDCVGGRHETPVTDRDGWWKDYPGADPAFASAKGHARSQIGDYAGRDVDTFSFDTANRLRKYGANWADVWRPLCHTRLRSWGFNTIGNWSDGAVKKLDRTPYTATLWVGGKSLEGSQGYWGKFHDVFDPSFAEAVADAINSNKDAIGDPWCLGFFVDNEIAWGGDTSLATASLTSPADQAAKKVFVADLQARYGDIAKLNAAWGADYASWDALLAARKEPDAKKAADDLHTFYTKFAETYFKTIADQLHAAAPHQLYLGCRFAWVNDLAQRAAGKYCDVVSFNLYQRNIAQFHSAAGDKPLIVGEFHFGALDRGMFHTGLVPCDTQQKRADSYRAYVEGALRHPQFVGTHWFEFQDEPLTGRTLDGENYQIGLIDQQDTPYPETIAATRAVGDEMYRLRAGKLPADQLATKDAQRR